MLDDPAYQLELETLDELIVKYQAARAARDEFAILLLLGMMLMQHSVIYKLSPPAGLVDVPEMFRR